MIFRSLCDIINGPPYITIFQAGIVDNEKIVE